MNDLKPLYDFGSDVLPVIAGPCSAESREQTLDTARGLVKAGVKVFRAGLWKPRTKPGGFEGVGESGLPWLREVRDLTGMAVATEVASRYHVMESLRSGVDILWIGARTTANPFAVQEIADALADAGVASDIVVLVKNPVNPDIELWDGALHRFYNAGVRHLGAVHRGITPYGPEKYRNSPCWELPTRLRVRYPSLPVFFDPSHVAGRREFVEPLSQTALDMGFYGIMAEVHSDPANALSDADQQLTPDDFAEMLCRLLPRRFNCNIPDDRLSDMRRQIDAVDADILAALARRMTISREIGEYKQDHNISAVQPERYNDILRSRSHMAESLGLDPQFIRTLMLAIHDESVRQQLRQLSSE